MRILMMVSWYSPRNAKVGIGIFHYEQAKELQKNCEIAIYYPYDQNIINMSKQMENGIYVYRSAYNLKQKIRNRVHMYCAMKTICKEFKPDLIHVQVATEAGRFAVILGKLFKIPVMVTEHSTIEASGVEHFPLHQYAKFTYKNSLYNACVSETLTRQLEAIFPECKFHTIYNGIVIPKEIDKSINYRIAGCINIILVASLYDRDIKGIPNLLQAFRNIKEKTNDVKLHIVGDGIYEEEFKQLAITLGIDKDCIFHGRFEKDRVYAIISQMDFLVSASRIESFGCTIAEAMIMGKPVLATKSGGPESIVTEKTGILVEKDSVAELSKGLLQMLERYQEYDKNWISEEARKKFGIDVITKKYLEIYENIVNN